MKLTAAAGSKDLGAEVREAHGGRSSRPESLRRAVASQQQDARRPGRGWRVYTGAKNASRWVAMDGVDGRWCDGWAGRRWRCGSGCVDLRHLLQATEVVAQSSWHERLFDSSACQALVRKRGHMKAHMGKR